MQKENPKSYRKGKMEVISEDKLTIWFIGDIAYEVEIPELKVQEKY